MARSHAGPGGIQSNDSSRTDRCAHDTVQGALWQFHRRCLGRAGRRALLRQHLADQWPGHHLDRPVERGGCRAGARCRACRQGCLGTHQPGRTGADPQSHRRPDGGEPRRPGRGRDLGQRQADPRDHGRGRAARHRPFPLFRRLHPRPGRRAVADRRRHRRLPFPRAPGCRGPDHPVELSAADGLLETGAGAGGGQLRRAEAGRADPGLDPALDGPGRRPAAAGRSEHRQRLRARVRQAARLVPAHRQDRLHRRDHDRPADHAVRQPEPDPGHAGAGRQVARTSSSPTSPPRTTTSSTRRSKASPCSR